MVIIIDKKTDKKKITNSLAQLKSSRAKQPKLADFYGKLKNSFGDGISYQKKMRGEWD